MLLLWLDSKPRLLACSFKQNLQLNVVSLYRSFVVIRSHKVGLQALGDFPMVYCEKGLYPTPHTNRLLFDRGLVHSRQLENLKCLWHKVVTETSQCLWVRGMYDLTEWSCQWSLEQTNELSPCAHWKNGDNDVSWLGFFWIPIPQGGYLANNPAIGSAIS